MSPRGGISVEILERGGKKILVEVEEGLQGNLVRGQG